MGKKELRKRFKKILKSIDNRKEREKEMVFRLLNDERMAKASVISVFASFEDEINTWPLIEGLLQKHIRVLLPTTGKENRMSMKEIKSLDDLTSIGPYGIKEPGFHCHEIPKNEITLVVVPGLSFDKKGHRLGRGKGYYDEYLSNSSLKTLGIGFKEQLIDDLPTDPWDILLDDVLLF